MHRVLVSQHNIDIFRREINTQWKCRQPNIVMMIAATNQHGIPLIVTELMDTSLNDELGRRSFNDEGSAGVAKDIAKGVNHLHHTRPVVIIHRDISSANILLQKRGTSWTAKEKQLNGQFLGEKLP